MPEQIWQEAREGVRCFAKVNLGEEDPLNLRFEEWEPSDNCNEPLKQATR